VPFVVVGGVIRNAKFLFQLPEMTQAFDMHRRPVKMRGHEIKKVLSGVHDRPGIARTFGAEPLFIDEFELSARVDGVFWAGRIRAVARFHPLIIRELKVWRYGFRLAFLVFPLV